MNPRTDEQGAVSVFLIMIFAVLFAFVAIFIDFSRMNAVRAQSEITIHAAVRSVLSSYEPELMERYGLFAVGSTDSDYIYSKVLQDSYSLTSQKEGLNLLGAKPKLDASELELSRPLGLYTVFMQQIREQMKYKAPVNLALEIWNKLKPGAEVMKEASGTMDELGKLQKLYQQREERISRVFKLQQEAHERVKSLSVSLKATSQGGGGEMGGQVASLPEAEQQYGDYLLKMAEDATRKPQDKVYTAELAAYRDGTSKAFSRSTQLLQQASSSLSNLPGSALPLIEQAKALDDQMAEVIQQAENRPEGTAYDAVKNGPSAGNETAANGIQNGEMGQIRSQSRALLRGEAFFTALSKSISAQKDDFMIVNQTVSALLSNKAQVLGGSLSEAFFHSVVLDASAAVSSYVSQIESALALEKQQIMEQHGSDKEIKQAETAAEAKLKEAGSLIGRLSALKGDYQEQQKVFQQLKGYEEEIQKLNASAEEAEPVNNQSSDIYNSGTEAMKGMDKLYGSLAEFLQHAADSCFQTEYTADYFSFFDVSKLKDLITGNASDSLNGEEFAPQAQEAEYILYGFHQPAGNLAASFGEIFAMRLAIRTMEGFIVNANKGYPLLILAAALLYGVEHAVEDLGTLVKTGSVQLSKYLNVSVSYKDHIRIFMLLHGASESRLSRMLALIRLNTSINPGEKSTYVRGMVKTGIPLLFIPGVSKAVNAVFSREGEVEGSGYFAVKQAEDAY